MLRPNEPLGKGLSIVYDLLVLSILYLVTTLPVITVGVATIALYENVYAVLELRDGVLFKDYFQAFKRNLKPGFGMLLFYALQILLMGGISGAAILLGAPVKLTVVVVVAVIGGIGCWVVALAGRFDQKLGVTVRNAYLIGIRNIHITLLLALINFGIPLLVWLLPEEFLRWYLFLLMFFAPAGCAFLTAKLVLRVLDRQYPEQNERVED